MKTTLTLRDGRRIETTYTDEIHYLLGHMSTGGQDDVTFLIADVDGRIVELLVGDVTRIEVAR